MAHNTQDPLDPQNQDAAIRPPGGEPVQPLDVTGPSSLALQRLFSVIPQSEMILYNDLIDTNQAAFAIKQPFDTSQTRRPIVSQIYDDSTPWFEAADASFMLGLVSRSYRRAKIATQNLFDTSRTQIEIEDIDRFFDENGQVIPDRIRHRKIQGRYDGIGSKEALIKLIVHDITIDQYKDKVDKGSQWAAGFATAADIIFIEAATLGLFGVAPIVGRGVVAGGAAVGRAGIAGGRAGIVGGRAGLRLGERAIRGVASEVRIGGEILLEPISDAVTSILKAASPASRQKISANVAQRLKKLKERAVRLKKARVKKKKAAGATTEETAIRKVDDAEIDKFLEDITDLPDTVNPDQPLDAIKSVFDQATGLTGPDRETIAFVLQLNTAQDKLLIAKLELRTLGEELAKKTKLSQDAVRTLRSQKGKPTQQASDLVTDLGIDARKITNSVKEAEIRVRKIEVILTTLRAQQIKFRPAFNKGIQELIQDLELTTDEALTAVLKIIERDKQVIAASGKRGLAVALTTVRSVGVATRSTRSRRLTKAISQRSFERLKDPVLRSPLTLADRIVIQQLQRRLQILKTGDPALVGGSGRVTSESILRVEKSIQRIRDKTAADARAARRSRAAAQGKAPVDPAVVAPAIEAAAVIGAHASKTGASVADTTNLLVRAWGYNTVRGGVVAGGGVFLQEGGIKLLDDERTWSEIAQDTAIASAVGGVVGFVIPFSTKLIRSVGDDTARVAEKSAKTKVGFSKSVEFDEGGSPIATLGAPIRTPQNLADIRRLVQGFIRNPITFVGMKVERMIGRTLIRGGINPEWAQFFGSIARPLVWGGPIYGVAAAFGYAPSTFGTEGMADMMKQVIAKEVDKKLKGQEEVSLPLGAESTLFARAVVEPAEVEANRLRLVGLGEQIKSGLEGPPEEGFLGKLLTSILDFSLSPSTASAADIDEIIEVPEEVEIDIEPILENITEPDAEGQGVLPSKKFTPQGLLDVIAELQTILVEKQKRRDTDQESQINRDVKVRTAQIVDEIIEAFVEREVVLTAEQLDAQDTIENFAQALRTAVTPDSFRGRVSAAALKQLTGKELATNQIAINFPEGVDSSFFDSAVEMALQAARKIPNWTLAEATFQLQKGFDAFEDEIRQDPDIQRFVGTTAELAITAHSPLSGLLLLMAGDINQFEEDPDQLREFATAYRSNSEHIMLGDTIGDILLDQSYRVAEEHDLVEAQAELERRFMNEIGHIDQTYFTGSLDENGLAAAGNMTSRILAHSLATFLDAKANGTLKNEIVLFQEDPIRWMRDVSGPSVEDFAMIMQLQRMTSIEWIGRYLDADNPEKFTQETMLFAYSNNIINRLVSDELTLEDEDVLSGLNYVYMANFLSTYQTILFENVSGQAANKPTQKEIHKVKSQLSVRPAGLDDAEENFGPTRAVSAPRSRLPIPQGRRRVLSQRTDIPELNQPLQETTDIPEFKP